MAIKRITLAVFLLASCNLAWQFYRMHRESVELHEQHVVIACHFGPSTDVRARVCIELLLLLALIGGRLTHLQKTLLTVIGLSGATIVYMLWWQFVFRVASNAEASVQALPHFLYLWGGNTLDLAIALSIATLIVLNIQDAIHSLIHGTD